MTQIATDCKLQYSGLKQTIYLPGDKVSINCTSSFSFPSAKLSWHLNNKPVDRWMVTSYLPTTDNVGLESSSLALNFLVLPEHFRGPEQELWATCKADMPMVHGMEIPMERTLLLGSLAGRLDIAIMNAIKFSVNFENLNLKRYRLRYHQGGWASANSGFSDDCDQGVMWLLLSVLTLHRLR